MTKILLMAILCCTVQLMAQAPLYTVNAVLGDESFVQIFGTAPNEETQEILRIQTHLQFVENKLRNETPLNLTKKQKRKRKQVLDLLHEYGVAGTFPSNHDYPGERKPCFIDRDGKICAVGYLIEKTEGRNVAEKINAAHQYKLIKEMNDEIVITWAKENGLTLEECAMIQPTYGGMRADETVDVSVKTSYGICSGLIGGTNVAINVFNVSAAKSIAVSKIGLVTGTAQLVLGLANIRKDKIDYGLMGYSTRTSYKAQNNLSYINIAAGTATLVTSSLNLLLNKKKPEVKNNIGFYSVPSMNNELTMGVSLVRRL